MNIEEELKKLNIGGEIDSSLSTIEKYSHDASMFEIRPKVVVFASDSEDITKVVNFVHHNKKANKDLSITIRSAGTDMAGGAINDSIIIDVSKYINKLIELDNQHAIVQPGMFYRDFEVETLKKNVLMPSYPASKDLASVGGMVANNSGGERSLEYGKVKDFINYLKVIFADGNEYLVKPLNFDELQLKLKQEDFEGEVYRNIYKLVEDNYDIIKQAKPIVSKNSMGYTLWEVWDRETKIFDLTKLIVGSQGTLGVITEIDYRLVPNQKHSGLLVLFLKDIDGLGEIIPKVLEYKPATFESFDDQTLWLSIRFMPSFLKLLGFKKFLHLIISLIPDGLQLLRGIPKLILMVEFRSDDQDEVRSKIKQLHAELKKYRARYEINGEEEDPTEGKSEKFWVMRRESFNLLRSKVKNKHTAPFIDDLIINPEYITAFLPKIRKIISKYGLFATIAGHMGDGNFHIIPLMEIEKQSERAKLLPAMKEVNRLVLSFRGSLSGEHNDGLVRGPWLKEQFGAEVYDLFKEVKAIFDKDNIFNPHKKSDASWDYSFSHIRDHF
ncbi:MAG: FAD-binding oxidoreductase [Patescibacteria group bacterium]|jgi:FAD/FMN-containing dehydrogenase|nr:FAD-binding oxidoreductase [Patescibacteria group bacterium]